MGNWKEKILQVVDDAWSEYHGQRYFDLAAIEKESGKIYWEGLDEAAEVIVRCRTEGEK